MSTKPTPRGALLSHHVKVDSELGTFNFAQPNLADFVKLAEQLLSNRKIAAGTDSFRIALESQDNPVAHLSAWLFCACQSVLHKIAELPVEVRPIALDLVTFAFHAGDLWASINVEKRLRHMVIAGVAQEESLVKARASRKRKITADQYVKANRESKTKTLKDIARKLGRTPQGVRYFEKKNPKLKTRE